MNWVTVGLAAIWAAVIAFVLGTFWGAYLTDQYHKRERARETIDWESEFARLDRETTK